MNGGLRAEHYETTFAAVDATGLLTSDLRASDVILSGKAGLLFKATAAGNVYVSYGSTVTPPGTANFTLSAQANNQNNPNVKPQESTNYEVGSKWDFANGRLSLNTAIFRTENRNVILHRRRHGDPADLQPGRQPARQRRLGRIDRPHHECVGGVREFRLSRQRAGHAE